MRGTTELLTDLDPLRQEWTVMIGLPVDRSEKMRTWRVLIVEDDRTVARIHGRHVSQQAEFLVVGIATSGTQARKFVTTLKPDLVLLDLGLPGVNGISLLRELRTAGDPVEVIVVSGYANPSVVHAAVQLGVVDYLVKPFWPARLTEALDAFVGRIDTLGERRLNQEGVDRLRTGAQEEHGPEHDTAKAARLSQVRSALTASEVAMSAEEIAAQTGMARVTARRYLERLVGLGQCTVDQMAEGPGRPRKMYRLWITRPVGGPPAARR
jgi:response regulator of citrate/malate metabolism